MKIAARHRTRTLVAVLTAAVIGLAGGTVAVPPAVAAEAPPPPALVRTVSESGFSHPGVGFTGDHLENMRAQVQAGAEPWASYYEAMTDTRYAARDFRAENAQAGSDTPKDDAYASVGMRSVAHRDGIGAMTQALEYFVTGDEQYRANALHVVRTWSSLDPEKYAYFSDAHIHTGVPLYYILIAAELLRSTEPASDTLDGYDLAWTDTDEQRLETNLIRPVLETFLSSNNRLWNQHLYGVIGMVAAAIYLDDADLYAERVEWFTVNAGYESEHDLFGGDVNGALAAIFREIPADDPRNTTGAPFVQHMEMLRDQAHGQGDVDLLIALARLVDNQGTTLDPDAGTVSDAADAVSPYRFLDNRILAGADTFYAFMTGDEVPYVPATEGGAISQAYRGRLVDPLSETYLQYRYRAGVDVAAEAPHVAELYENRDGPMFYSGPTVQNFWNDRGSDYTGAEYWVAFPEELAEVPDAAAPLPASAELAVDTFGTPIGAGAVRGQDADGPAYVRLDAAAEESRVAVRRAVWSDRTQAAPVGIRVRSDGTARLELARSAIDAPFASITVPDTHGQWRYVWVDLNVDETSGPVGENIVVISATGSDAQVDIASVLAQAAGVLSPPTFADAPALAVVAVAGEPWARDFAVEGADELTLEDAPPGAELNNGTVTWTPTQTGDTEMLVVASDGTAITALPVTVSVAADRAAAIDQALAGVGEASTYTSESWARADAARTAAVDGQDAAPDAFAGLLEQLATAVAQLAPLNPLLADGSLDVGAVATAPALTTAQLRALTDGDNQSHWGDQRISEVVFDLGPSFRVRADAFGIQARDGFANRSQGTNVYGSNDGVTWTLLTESPNAGQDAAIERLDVIAELRAERFRFVKLRVDEPGVPSDPAFPGIWSIAEFRIHGERIEAVGSMSGVTLAAVDDGDGRIVPGDRVELTLTGPAGNTDVRVAMLGEDAAVTSTGAGEWVAAATVPEDAGVGAPVSFRVDFTTAAGVAADPIVATTDGSSLYVSTDAGSLADALRDAAVLRPDGTVDAAWTAHALRMTDGDAATHSDNRLNAGTYGHIWDFGADTEVVVTGAEIRVRQDGYGISRIADLRLEGSDDGQTWTRLTPATPGKTLAWQQWPVANAAADTAYRYVRIANGQILGVAELRLFGEVRAVPSADPAWEAERVYDAGDRVSSQGRAFVAQWWTRGEAPGATTTGSWMEEGEPAPDAGADVRSWTASWVYDSGDVVAFAGQSWRARWWTRGQQPGDAHGPWEPVAAG